MRKVKKVGINEITLNTGSTQSAPASESIINLKTNHVYDERKIQIDSNLAFDFN